MWRLLVFSLTGCSLATATCPIETHPVHAGRTEACVADDRTLTTLPAPGRTYESALGRVAPVVQIGGLEGPYTSRHPNGAIAMRGSYLRLGSRSVPDGLWVTYDEDGRRRAIGMYDHGTPVGCFEIRGSSDTLVTGVVEGTQVHERPCTPPSEPAALSLPPARADISLEGFATPTGFGVHNAAQIDTDPRTRAVAGALVRFHVGRFVVGPLVGVRFASDSDYHAYRGGVSTGLQLPSFHPRFSSEASIDLALERITVDSRHADRPIGTQLVFVQPQPALHVATSMALSPSLDGFLGLRIEGLPSRDAKRESTYCGLVDCLPPIAETWRVGGLGYGLELGLRFVIR